MKTTRKPPSKHDWLQKTHINEIPSWDLNQCLAYFSLSECTQLKLPGGGIATQSKDLVHEQLVRLIGRNNDKKKPDPQVAVAVAVMAAAAAAATVDEEEIDFTALVYALNLLQCLIDRAFPFVKLPQVVISTHGSKDKVLHDIASLHQNALLLMQMIHRYNSGIANNKNHHRNDDDDIASIVGQRQ